MHRRTFDQTSAEIKVWDALAVLRPEADPVLSRLDRTYGRPDQ
jgi:hypothetical protein